MNENPAVTTNKRMTSRVSLASLRRQGQKKLPRVSEKHVQRQIVDYLKLIGAEVYVLGTVRRKGDHPGTMQTPGIPDLYAFLKPGIFSADALWIEVKAEGGKCSPAQLSFQKLAKERGINYVCGGFQDLLNWLNGMGYIRQRL